jgi:hypothetical protein
MRYCVSAEIKCKDKREMDDLGKDKAEEAVSETENFSLDDILMEFADETEPVEEQPDESAPQTVKFTDSDGVKTAEVSSEEAPGPIPSAPPEPEPERPKSRPEEKTDYDIVREYKPVGAEDLDELLKEVRMDFVTDSDAAPADYAPADVVDEAPEAPAAPKKPVQEAPSQKPQRRRQPAPSPEDMGDEPPEPQKPERPFGERIAAPFVAMMAVISMKRQQRRATVKAAPPEGAEDLGPEMDADRASKYYGSHIKGLRSRVKTAFLLCLPLMYISFGLPVLGRLHNNTVCTLMCLVLELAVVVVCLDVFTSGIMDLVRKKPGAASLIAVSCILSALDAAVIAATGSKDVGLPFCAVSALSISCALWASLLQCKGNRITLRTLALSKDPYAVTAEPGVSDDKGVTLLKSKTAATDFVRRTEEMTPDEEIYSTLAPWLMGAALILSVAAAAISKSFPDFAHILAAIFMPAAPLGALLAFPLPYSVTSRRIFHSGSAIAGWSGLLDIGGSRHIIVTDSDIFPKDTVSVESIRVLEGMSPQKIIGYAGSVIAASGSGLAPVFTELMKKNGCALEQVDEFCCHEGGGLTAMINGEEVLCGSSGFMHLMGIRLPQKLASRSSVFVSVNGMISAIFTVSYTPVVTVQRALISLLRSRRRPIFAIRDFNVTPEMIRHKFKTPTDGFDFPSFAKRYEVSSARRSKDSKIAAVVSREGLGPLVELSGEGHRLYFAVRTSVFISVMCTIIGMALMFFLCLTAAFDSVTVGNQLLYMLLWLLPEIILAYGLGR